MRQTISIMFFVDWTMCVMCTTEEEKCITYYFKDIGPSLPGSKETAW